MASSTTPRSTMDAGQYCLVCDGQCQQDEPIQITWGNSPNDIKLYWTPQLEKLSIALSLHFPDIEEPSVQKRAVLNMFKLSPLSNRSATSDFSFASSQDNFPSPRTSAGSIRSLQSTSLSNTPTGNNSSQSHRVAKARHHACAAHRDKKRRCDPNECPDCPDRLNPIDPLLASPSSATPQSIGGISPIGSQPRRTHSAPANQRKPSERFGGYSPAPNMAFGPSQPPVRILPSQNVIALSNSTSINPCEGGDLYQSINSFPLGVGGEFEVQSSGYNVEEDSRSVALYTGNDIPMGNRYIEPNLHIPNPIPPGTADAWYYQPSSQQMPTQTLQVTPQTYTIPNAPFGYPGNVYNPNQDQNVREIEQEISPPAVDKEQVEQAILLSLRKAFKGLVVALLGRACRRLRKDM